MSPNSGRIPRSTVDQNRNFKDLNSYGKEGAAAKEAAFKPSKRRQSVDPVVPTVDVNAVAPRSSKRTQMPLVLPDFDVEVTSSPAKDLSLTMRSDYAYNPAQESDGYDDDMDGNEFGQQYGEDNDDQSADNQMYQDEVLADTRRHDATKVVNAPKVPIVKNVPPPFNPPRPFAFGVTIPKPVAVLKGVPTPPPVSIQQATHKSSSKPKTKTPIPSQQRDRSASSASSVHEEGEDTADKASKAEEENIRLRNEIEMLRSRTSTGDRIAPKIMPTAMFVGGQAWSDLSLAAMDWNSAKALPKLFADCVQRNWMMEKSLTSKDNIGLAGIYRKSILMFYDVDPCDDAKVAMALTHYNGSHVRNIGHATNQVRYHLEASFRTELGRFCENTDLFRYTEDLLKTKDSGTVWSQVKTHLVQTGQCCYGRHVLKAGTTASYIADHPFDSPLLLHCMNAVFASSSRNYFHKWKLCSPSDINKNFYLGSSALLYNAILTYKYKNSKGEGVKLESTNGDDEARKDSSRQELLKKWCMKMEKVSANKTDEWWTELITRHWNEIFRVGHATVVEEDEEDVEEVEDLDRL